MTEEKSLVPPAKYIFLMAASLIVLVGVGGALGFENFGQRFLENVGEYHKYESGMGYIKDNSGTIYVDIGIDMKKAVNETHGIVCWYKKVPLASGSTIIDLLQNITKAENVQLRLYELNNPSNWKTYRDNNTANYNITVEYGEIAGMRYIVSINDLRNNAGELKQWMVYLWDPNVQVFSFLDVPLDICSINNNDNVVLLYDQISGYPNDCCSGVSGFVYDDYTGPK